MIKAMLAAAAVVFAFAPAASADAVCQIIEGTTVCVTTVGDPTTGSFGAGVSGGPLNVCVVVFAACP